MSIYSAELSTVKIDTNSNTQGFATFKIDQILDNSVTDFDLFLSIQNHIVLYSGNHYSWKRAELHSLIANGYTDFLIKNSDRAKADSYLQISKLPSIQKNLPPQSRIVNIESIGAEFIRCMHSGEISGASVEKANDIAKAMVGCIVEDPSCVKFLSGLGDHDYYTYVHSVRVAAYTVAVAFTHGLQNEESLREMALGGLFHDVGKKSVPAEVLNKSGSLSNEEWKMMRSHPEQGISAINETILSMVPREIILHHHEKLDGSGYPHGLDANSLLQEVQIATVADVFDALTSSRSYQNKRSRYEALDFMKHQFAGSKISAEIFKALVACLAK